MNLSELMAGSGLTPTQTDVYEGSIDQYAEAMRTGDWDWNKTRTDLMAPMLLDREGRILAGHHRFIAARKAGIDIPPGVVRILGRLTAGRPTYAWSDVTLRSGARLKNELSG